MNTMTRDIEIRDSFSYAKARIKSAVFLFYFSKGRSFAFLVSRISDIRGANHVSDGTFGSCRLAMPLVSMSIEMLSGVSYFGFLTGPPLNGFISEMSNPCYCLQPSDFLAGVFH